MAEVIQFHCPACGTFLRVPIEAAGFRGPCPRCSQEIIGPEPLLGLAARRAEHPFEPPQSREASPAPKVTKSADPFSPFSKQSHDPEPEPFVKLAPKKQVAQPIAEPPAPAPPVENSTSSNKGTRTIFVLSLLVASLAGLMAGYLIGSQQPFDISPLTPNSGVPSKKPLEASVDEAEPSPEAAPIPGQQPIPEVSTPDAKIEEQPLPSLPAGDVVPEPDEPDTNEPDPSAESAATDALKAFLKAPDWAARIPYILHGEQKRQQIEAYYLASPDEATVALSIEQSDVHDDGKNQIVRYQVATAAVPDGFPVSVFNTKEGWKVDWDSFVEFRDDHFQRFANGEGPDSGSFRLFVRNTHYFGEAFRGSDELTAFRVDPPLPERNHYAFVRTGSEIHKRLAASIEWGKPCVPTLEIFRRVHEDGTSHLEITAIDAPNWLPDLD